MKRWKVAKTQATGRLMTVAVAIRAPQAVPWVPTKALRRTVKGWTAGSAARVRPKTNSPQAMRKESPATATRRRGP